MEVRFPQVRQIEGRAMQVDSGEVVADQHLLGVVHRRLCGLRHKEDQRKQR